MKQAIVLIMLAQIAFGQPYLKDKGKTRHRFAQTVFGFDMQASKGGSSAMINDGKTENFRFGPQINPRIYISGTHFWGHAEFYFAFQFPAINKNSYQGIRYSYLQSDIFGTKIYPWPVQKKKIRPFAGFAISGISYWQYSNSDDGFGPIKTLLRVPLIAGINYCSGGYLFDLSLSYNYDNRTNYWISRDTRTTLSTAPVLLSFGIRKWLETTTPMEKDYLDGSTEKRYLTLKQNRKLSSWFAGIGPSSAFYTRSSPLNKQLFPFLDKPFAAFFPEVSAGYYCQPMGLHIGTAFRHNSSSQRAFGIAQNYKRTSVSVESFAYLFDYNGFNPYAGLCASYEWLGFSHWGDGDSYFFHRTGAAAGIIMGWDIVPDKLQGIILRTSLRYFPNLGLSAIQNKKVFLDQLEFNFIQLIVYPQRIKNIRKSFAGQQ